MFQSLYFTSRESYAILILCDESIWSLDQIYAGEVINAGADLDDLCEPFHLMETCP